MLLRAHVAGALDLSKADVLDPRWWKRAEFIIQEFERQAELKLDEYEYQLSLALIDHSAGEEVLKVTLDTAENLCNKFEQDLRPWDATAATGDLRDTIADMKARYIEVFGDPATPEFQAEMARTVAYLRGDK